jgi:hypothetical protein
MNGRIYDPKLGRFLQADPFVQAPENAQNLNRYSYVLNNPLSYTDPSGYFSVSRFVKKWGRLIVAAVATWATYGWASTWAGAWYAAGTAANAAIAGAVSGFVGGAILTGTLEGAFYGAVSGAALGAIGASSWNKFTKTVASGSTQGVVGELQGGKFGHGFLSAGVGFWTGLKFGGPPSVGKFVGSMIAGGVISEMTGGKFENGAFSAGLAYMLAAGTTAGSDEGEWMFPEGGSTDIGAYIGEDGTIPVYTNGILGKKGLFQDFLNRMGAPGYFNPSHGFFADIIESFGQKYFGWAGDPLARGFAERLEGINHPLKIIAHSQGTLTVTNAVRYFGLSAQGSTFVMKSPALSYFAASRAIQNRGGTMVWNQPAGDIANIYAPSLNPLRWASGFGDILCGICRHTANGLP